MRKPLLIYLVIVTFMGLGLCFTLDYGRRLPAPATDGISTVELAHGQFASSGDQPASSASLGAMLRRHLDDPLARLLLQLIVIVLTTRGFGIFFAAFRQPAVIGEMAAGLLLGPSLLGWVWPACYRFIFPTESLATLKLLSQIGVCLYMFVVGMELDLERLRRRVSTAVLVSHASILVPYWLGVVASLALYTHYAGPRVTFVHFALFMGIAMSITAFPVLARILEERRLANTELGNTAITCAAVDDVSAWTILAVIVAIHHAVGLGAALLSLGLVLAFVMIMAGVVRPRLPGWMHVDQLDHGAPTKALTAGVLLFILASALATEIMGIHSLFGAFLAGVVMPKRRDFRHYLSIRIEQFSSVFLLPLFFAFTGLRTQVGLLNDGMSWLVCLALIVIATAGKLGGSMLTARITGMTWRDSFSLGALMNTRGLMELIALNLGYDFGILSPAIFTMMVVMALATTVMTGPLLSVAERSERRSLHLPS